MSLVYSVRHLLRMLTSASYAASAARRIPVDWHETVQGYTGPFVHSLTWLEQTVQDSIPYAEHAKSWRLH